MAATSTIEYPKDKIIQAVLNKYKERADRGMIKYNISMEDNDGNLFYWLNHLQQELMDATNYTEKLITIVDSLEAMKKEKENARASN